MASTESGAAGSAQHLRSLSRLDPIWRRAQVVRFSHQLDAATRIVDELGGSAILADEVGLGKTIEAALVLEEGIARGTVRRALILCPASLVWQWEQELWQKFGRRAALQPRGPAHCPLVIASLDWAKRRPQNIVYQRVPWDLVIVDEAHHLKTRSSLNHSFVRDLRRKHLLLVTATPIQNELTELYNLVSLVKPDLFGSYTRFYRRFLLAPRRPRNVDELRSELSEVMVRRTRQEAHIELPPRQVELEIVDLAPDERRLYDRVSMELQKLYLSRRAGRQTILPLILIQRELCSSTFALVDTLTRMGANWFGAVGAELLAQARSIERNTKAEAAAAYLRGVRESAIVFTEYRATQQFLADRLAAEQLLVHRLHGGQARAERRGVLRTFAERGGVLVTTECGDQGLNLQTASVVVNYDLPWNPMRVEQRIGRAHRLGQTKPVRILNLSARDTVEEHVLRLLHEKIDMFRRVIGDLDVIIRHLERDRPLEMELFELFLNRDPQEIESELDRIAHKVRRSESADAAAPSQGQGA